jgi:nucleoside-diphosphate-sugar epimerase
VLSALERPTAIGSLYNVAGPEPVPFADLLRACADAVGSRTRMVPFPVAPLMTLARGYELVSRRPRLRVEQLRRLSEDKAFPIDDAVRDLGYAPRPFADGIGEEARLLGLTA